MNITRKSYRFGATLYLRLAGTPEEVQREVNCLYNYGALVAIPENQESKKNKGGIDEDYKEGISSFVEVHGSWANFVPALRCWFRTQFRSLLKPSDLSAGYRMAKENVKLWREIVEEGVQSYLTSMQDIANGEFPEAPEAARDEDGELIFA